MDITTYWLIHKNDFREFFKRLNQRDIHNVRQQVDVLQARGKKDSSIINSLQRRPKLKEKWEAERAFRTESKRLESIDAKNEAEDRGMDKFYIVLNKDACPACKKLTRNGKRIFTRKEIGKGDTILIPHHPNCKCTLSPVF
jgi:hypothetical protein